MKKHTHFIPGLQLGELFYNVVVAPLLQEKFKGLQYSAGLLGEGSEVLGYDTSESTDHCWGPRTMLFLSEKDFRKLALEITNFLLSRIPKAFRGYATDLRCPVKSTFDIYTIASFFERELAVSPFNMKIYDWLRFPSQRLLEVTRGKVFHDGLGLEQVRRKFTYYPRDIWLYLLSCQWVKIGQEEAFAGRCHAVGDELGSRVVTSRIVRELMKLCFLMERKYAPYSKWFGTAFGELEAASRLEPVLGEALSSRSWSKREKALSTAYELVAGIHNSLKITPPLPTKVSKYYDRPYLVIHADLFAKEIRKKIRNMKIRNIPTNAGGIDQFADSTDILSYPRIFKRIDLWS